VTAVGALAEQMQQLVARLIVGECRSRRLAHSLVSRLTGRGPLAHAFPVPAGLY
jgi:hypothetical protein